MKKNWGGKIADGLVVAAIFAFIFLVALGLVELVLKLMGKI